MPRLQDIVEAIKGLSNGNGIISSPPVGGYKVTNLYVDPETGKLVVEYDDMEEE